MSGSHVWRFFRAGGSDQVALANGADLQHLAHLDPKLWVALACPVKGLEFDERTLSLMDSDNDGRLRQPEILAAIRWALSVVKNGDDLFRGGDLPLASINDATPEGKSILAAARQILSSLGKPEATSIGVADCLEPAKVFAKLRFNGDGILDLDAITDATDKAVASDLLATLGGDPDRGGKLGLSAAKIAQFYADAAAQLAWQKRAESEAATLLPLGPATGAAAAAVQAVRAKVDDFFARCRLAAYDARALGALNRADSEYLPLAAKDLTAGAQELAAWPLARIEAGASLPLTGSVNPAWAAAIATLQSAAITPLLGAGKTSLSAAEWAQLQARLAPYEAWQASKPGAAVEKLGAARLAAILAGKSQAALNALIAQDAAVAGELVAIAQVERLARYYRDLVPLLNNFVAFRDFYSRQHPAIFQAGTLYLDGRGCELCVRVADAGKHAALAGMSKSYLAYCDCTRPGGEKLSIAAAFTGGDSDNLMVGRNGVFFDRQGRDWDATITRVVDNPISIGQAFWSPYKKLVRLIEEQVAKRAAAAQAEADAKVGNAATSAANVDKAKPAEAKKMDVGTVAALGVAFGALATAFAAIAGYLTGVLHLPFWQICLAFAGVLLLISLPSMLIAWLKLRQRNLGPILDANGWAINGRVQMNVPFGGRLTKVATLPDGALPSLAVKYPEPPTMLPKAIGLLLLLAFLVSLANHFGLIYKLSDGLIGQPRIVVPVVVPAAPAAPATEAAPATPAP